MTSRGTTPGASRPFRVGIQQPALPAYRVPLFRRVAALPGYEIELWYGSEEPALPNAAPDGFVGHFLPFVSIPSRARAVLMWHRAQWSLAGDPRLDALVLSWNTRFLSLFPALLRARARGLPAVVWGHGYTKREDGPVRAALRRLSGALATAVLVYDARTRARLIESGHDPGRLFVLSNGLDSDAIESARRECEPDPGHDRGASARARGPVLVHIGRLSRESRLELVLGAMASLVGEFPGVRLTVIGAGAEERDRLSALADEQGLTERIDWLGAIYEEREIARHMSRADLFVYPCNVGLSLIHAFNYGVPAVVCAPLSEHNPEVDVLRDGVNGRVAAERTPQSVAAAVRALLASPDELAEAGRQARLSVRHVHNLAAMSRAFEELFAFLATCRSSLPRTSG